MYICTQRELDRKDKPKTKKFGVTAIIVCLTTDVPKIARTCRDLLQMHQSKSKVIEAIVAHETASVTVSNGIKLMQSTV